MTQTDDTDKMKITEPDVGKHIAIASDINSIQTSKADTGGTYRVVEAKVFPNGDPALHIQTHKYEALHKPKREMPFTVVGKEKIAKQVVFVNVPRS